jgi:predicted DNA-binding transcriptional regulator AlpA
MSTANQQLDPTPRHAHDGAVGDQPARPRSRHRRRLSPLVADARLLAQLLGLGVRTVRTMDYAGRLPRPIKLGTRTVWLIREIREWLAAAKNGIPPDRRTWEAQRNGPRQ